MVFARTSMTSKEMYEGYKANIPSEIMEKMGSGFVLTDKEREIVRQHGKVYVLGYIKRKDDVLIKPQLRDLPKKAKSKTFIEKQVVELSESKLRDLIEFYYNRKILWSKGEISLSRKEIDELKNFQRALDKYRPELSYLMQKRLREE